MISFKFIQEENKNFTPASKMIQYANKNNISYYRTMFGTLLLSINGIDYEYNHYQITNNGDGTETVEIFLNVK